MHSAPELVIDERHLGLMPSNESELAEKKIAQLGERVADQVDIDRILTIAADVPALDFTEQSQIQTPSGQLRIGYPRIGHSVFIILATCRRCVTWGSIWFPLTP